MVTLYNWLNYQKDGELLLPFFVRFVSLIEKCPNQCTLLTDVQYIPKPLEEITRVIIRMWFLQESAMRMNGLHESNSKLNIRSYPKAKKTDSDLIVLLCPPALCSSLSTSETLQCINHLQFIALSRSEVHLDVLLVSFYTLGKCFFFNLRESYNSACMHLHIT